MPISKHFLRFASSISEVEATIGIGVVYKPSAMYYFSKALIAENSQKPSMTGIIRSVRMSLQRSGQHVLLTSALYFSTAYSPFSASSHIMLNKSFSQLTTGKRPKSLSSTSKIVALQPHVEPMDSIILANCAFLRAISSALLPIFCSLASISFCCQSPDASTIHFNLFINCM